MTDRIDDTHPRRIHNDLHSCVRAFVNESRADGGSHFVIVRERAESPVLNTRTVIVDWSVSIA